MLEHRFDLGDERVVDLQRLHGPERRLGQQRPGCGDRVDGVGLAQSPRAALGRGPRSRDFTGVEPGRRQGDRDVGPPLGRPLDADLFDAAGGERIDRLAVTGRGVRKGLDSYLDAVSVDDADGECVLVGVDSPEWW